MYICMYVDRSSILVVSGTDTSAVATSEMQRGKLFVYDVWYTNVHNYMDT